MPRGFECWFQIKKWLDLGVLGMNSVFWAPVVLNHFSLSVVVFLLLWISVVTLAIDVYPKENRIHGFNPHVYHHLVSFWPLSTDYIPSRSSWPILTIYIVVVVEGLAVWKRRGRGSLKKWVTFSFPDDWWKALSSFKWENIFITIFWN